MKKIAFYLPQFHQIPENDTWWGEGFTEWSNVKKASPLFRGHNQPEVPLGHNYYDLSDPDIQVWQSELAMKYGIDGFCYYHYWFEGKLLLEKPMENMLHNQKITIPFCICWANETWARTWDGEENDILIAQNYREDFDAWEAHFDYFVRFFRDERYIRHEGKPVLLIYKPQLITNCREMILFWRRLAVEQGLPGLYVGFQHCSAFAFDMEGLGFDFGVEFEPMYTIKTMKPVGKSCKDRFIFALKNPAWFLKRTLERVSGRPEIYDYDDVWQRIITRKHTSDKIYPGAFPSWDNTPRRGKKAIVFRGSTPEKFALYLKKYAAELTASGRNYDNGFMFINAWNEWAEGAHLEPDEVNRYGYLEAVRHMDSEKK